LFPIAGLTMTFGWVQLPDAGHQVSLPECPFHIDTSVAPAVTLPDVGPIATIPEFHDCQAFDVGGRFVGPFAVYALFEQENVWQLVAKRDLTGGGTRDTAILAAVIRSFGAAYAPLGIQPDYNCLYLFFDADNLVKGRILPNGTNPDCADFVPPFPASAPLLEVRRSVTPGLTAADYPPVARWERDPNTAAYHIGVLCGVWCEVGPPGFGSASTYNASGAMTRGFVLKGWYDEQELALPAPSSGAVVPSSIRGTVFPDPSLDGRVVADFAGRWTAVARIAFPAANAAYQSKLNLGNISLTAGPANLRPLNRLFMCHGTRAACTVPNSTRCSWATSWPSDRTPGDTTWWALVVSSSGVRRHFCVVRRAHPTGGKHVPGTARWRWSPSDETIWARCDQGCCEVDQ
jgi:hypothetical protein